MDIEIKTEFKNELYENINDIVMCDHHLEQVSNLEENQVWNNYYYYGYGVRAEINLFILHQ